MKGNKKNILFIINPISGVGKKNTIPPLIEKYLSADSFSWKIQYTSYRNHAREIALLEKHNFDAIIAVGGDGSVNEVGSALINSKCILGILPCGSGNGLARHLGIPLNLSGAIRQIAAFEPTLIDTGIVNDEPFIGICGFGFDAHIADKFETDGKRGFLTYAKLVLKEYNQFGSKHFTVKKDGETNQYKALLCTIANSSQYGNGFTISPKSDLRDGKFELVFIKRFKLYKGLRLAYRFFTKSVHKSTLFTSTQFNNEIELSVASENPTNFHIDGEAKQFKGSFRIKINPSSLQVL
jgi:diacylglycerol kinase (ATP)